MINSRCFAPSPDTPAIHLTCLLQHSTSWLEVVQHAHTTYHSNKPQSRPDLCARQKYCISISGICLFVLACISVCAVCVITLCVCVCVCARVYWHACNPGQFCDSSMSQDWKHQHAESAARRQSPAKQFSQTHTHKYCILSQPKHIVWNTPAKQVLENNATVNTKLKKRVHANHA